MSNKEKESTVIKVQIIASLVSIGTIIISIVLLYNLLLTLNDEDPFMSADEAQKLTTFNQSLILIIFIIFLLANYCLYYISKNEGEDLKVYSLKIIASYLSVASGIIGLYIISRRRVGDLVSDVETPII